jgi:hypothetical protein
MNREGMSANLTLLAVAAVPVVLILAGGLGFAAAFIAGALAGVWLVLSRRPAEPAVELAAAVSDSIAGWREFHRELARARRFNRPFAIVRYPDAAADPRVGTRLRDRIASVSRRIDRIWVDGTDLFALLPEADTGAVDAAVTRVRSRLGLSPAADIIATFPESGITSGALIAALYPDVLATFTSALGGGSSTGAAGDGVAGTGS